VKLSYFPGCSLTGTAAEYDRSIREVAEWLDIELVELEDWNCCGASSAHMTSHELGIELSARNLELAAQAGLDLLVPCSACFQRLRAADHALGQAPVDEGAKPWAPDFEVLHLTRLLARPEVLERLGKAVVRPLTGLRLACYYGCLSLRPPQLTGARDHEDPQGLDRLVKVLGAEAVRWSHKTECCSGSLTMARPDIARTLIGELLQAARRGGAQAIVTDCPMCQANLESRQLDLLRAEGSQAGLPVFFSTELVALALAAETAPKRFTEHLVDPGPVLGALGL
jgi:heterodisulfide reductase subunit B